MSDYNRVSHCFTVWLCLLCLPACQCARLSASTTPLCTRTDSLLVDCIISHPHNRVCISPPLPPSPPHHPGHRRVAKWSRSSCTTEATAGTATTASPAPAATRSCWMEPASSWTSTPLRTTTCWMGMLPPQVGSTGYPEIPPSHSLIDPTCGPLELPLHVQDLMNPDLHSPIR